MRNLAFLSFFFALLVSACHSNSKQPAENKTDTVYFPVNDYLAAQIKLVDSLQLPVTRYYSDNKHADTVALSLAEFRKQAEPFLETDLSDPRWKSKYTEKSFADQSVPSINFTYETRVDELPLKRVDIVLKPDPVQTDHVKSVYMEKLYTKGDTLINEKLFWKADHYYQIISSRQSAGGEAILSKLKVIWDPTE